MTTEEVQEEVLDALKMKGLILKDAELLRLDKVFRAIHWLYLPHLGRWYFKANSDVVTEDGLRYLENILTKR
jgi:ATP-dependent helicase/nuclease subunit B